MAVLQFVCRNLDTSHTNQTQIDTFYLEITHTHTLKLEKNSFWYMYENSLSSYIDGQLDVYRRKRIEINELLLVRV